VTTKTALYETQISLVERRGEERQVTTYRVARIITALGQEQLGIVRNVSVGGVMIETHAGVALGDRLWIEPTGSEPIWGAVVWSDQLRHGVAFDTPLPDDCLDALTAPVARRHIARPPRIAVDIDARLSVAGTGRTVRVCDVSQGGAKLECAAPLAEAEPAVLSMEGLGNIEGFVRWQHQGKVGLMFAEALAIGTLSAWLATKAPKAAVAAFGGRPGAATPVNRAGQQNRSFNELGERFS